MTCAGLELTGLMKPFDLEVYYGERVAVLGSNGSGSRISSGCWPAMSSRTREPGSSAPAWCPGISRRRTTIPSCGAGRSSTSCGRRRRGSVPAISALRRYELDLQADQFEALSGGQQARFQILLLELAGVTLLLLDEPTDNLDVASAEALEEGWRRTTAPYWPPPTIAGSRSFDRFLVRCGRHRV